MKFFKLRIGSFQNLPMIFKREFSRKISFNRKKEIGVNILQKQMEKEMEDPVNQTFNAIKTQSDKIENFQESKDYSITPSEEDTPKINFDFSKFTRRNNELEEIQNATKNQPKDFRKNIRKKDKQPKEEKDEKKELTELLGEEAMEKLEEMIEIDKSVEKHTGRSFDINDARSGVVNLIVDEDKVVTKKHQNQLQSIEETPQNTQEEPKNVLVNRPGRNFVWGVGEEVRQKRRSIRMFNLQKSLPQEFTQLLSK